LREKGGRGDKGKGKKHASHSIFNDVTVENGVKMIGHGVLNEIVGQIPNIWDKMKKPLHEKRSMQRGNMRKQLHVTCNVGKGRGS